VQKQGQRRFRRRALRSQLVVESTLEWPIQGREGDASPSRASELQKKRKGEEKKRGGGPSEGQKTTEVQSGFIFSHPSKGKTAEEN